MTLTDKIIIGIVYSVVFIVAVLMFKSAGDFGEDDKNKRKKL